MKSLITSVLHNWDERINGMRELPRQRLSTGLSAFTDTGTDYFGTLTTKLSKR